MKDELLPSAPIAAMQCYGQFFRELVQKIEAYGYADEIKWQRELQPCDNNMNFLWETCWVILNSGMKEQIARKIWERIQDAWLEERDISEVFRHKGKVAAIKYVKENSGKLFEGYVLAENKIEFLKTIPFIGNITCYHLAKNLGHDCVKPDRHLVRVANMYGTTPDAFCQKIAHETGEKKCVVDIVIWRACNLGFL